METNQNKSHNYQEVIKDIPKQSLVYIDESGIDMVICKDREWAKKAPNLLEKEVVSTIERTNIAYHMKEPKSASC